MGLNDGDQNYPLDGNHWAHGDTVRDGTWAVRGGSINVRAQAGYVSFEPFTTLPPFF